MTNSAGTKLRRAMLTALWRCWQWVLTLYFALSQRATFLKGFRSANVTAGLIYRFPILGQRLLKAWYRDSRGATILLYHDIEARRFESHIRFLQKHSKIISLDDLMDRIKKRQNLEDSVIITFDDGARSTYIELMPIIQKYQVPVTVYLVSDTIGTTAEFWWARKGKGKRTALTNYPLLLTEIQEMLGSGRVTFGSHTRTHACLTEVDPDRAEEEIASSKRDLELKLGTSIKHFAYPYGYFDPTHIEMLRRAGYSTAVTVVPDINVAGTDVYCLNRLSVSPQDNEYVLAMKIAGVWDRLGLGAGLMSPMEGRETTLAVPREETRPPPGVEPKKIATAPLVSIIMNCHNSSTYLAQALESVRRQTLKDYEVIFWDNQSTDNSAAIALGYGEPLRYFRGHTFLPLGAARNMAIRQAKGKYIALLDCDDVWMPEKLERQIDLLQRDPSLGLVYCDAYIIDGPGKRKGTYSEEHKPYSGDVFINLLTEGCFISCETAMFKREAFEAIGGFNPALELAEDYDLFLRMAHRYQTAYIPEPLANWRDHETNFSKKYSHRSKKEVIDVVASAVDGLGTLSKAQAKALEGRFTLLCARLLLEQGRRRHYFRIPPLIFELTRKYITLSAKLNRKMV